MTPVDCPGAGRGADGRVIRRSLARLRRVPASRLSSFPLSHQESQPVHRQSARRPPEELRRLRVGHYRVVRIGHRAGGAFPALTSLPPGSGPGRQRLIRQLCRSLYKCTDSGCTNSWRRPNCHGGWLPPEPPGAPAQTNHSASCCQQHPAPAGPARAAAPTPSRGYLFASKRPQPVKTDRRHYRVFQSAPDLIRELLPGSAAAANALGLNPSAPGDRLYRFEALEIKELSHHLEGVLWPRVPGGVSGGGALGQPGGPEPAVLIWTRLCCLCWLNGFLT